MDGTYDDVTRILSFNLLFTGLLTPTAQAHFHGPANPGANAQIIIILVGFPSGVTSGAFSNSYTLTASQSNQIVAGLWYVNIHTHGSFAGEIRAIES